jgi:hypothetical protein
MIAFREEWNCRFARKEEDLSEWDLCLKRWPIYANHRVVLNCFSGYDDRVKIVPIRLEVLGALESVRPSMCVWAERVLVIC